MNVDKKKLHLCMARACLNVDMLAEKSQVCKSTIITIMVRGTARYITVGKIAKGLGVDVTEILAD